MHKTRQIHKRTADRIVRDGATLMENRRYSPNDIANWLRMQYNAAMMQANRRG